MNRSKMRLFAIMIFFVLIPNLSLGEMESDNYRILASVLSAGGSSISSDNYLSRATLGQPSPLIDPAAPPFSDSYDLYSGFWYTLIVPECDCDLNSDGSCNGLDWLLFYPDWGRTDCNEPGMDPCECDLNSDGSCNGLDWLSFYPNWGRTNCPLP